MVRAHEADIANKLDVDPERYRRRAASELARADQVQQRREEGARAHAEASEDFEYSEDSEEAGDPEDTAQPTVADDEKGGSTAG